MLVQCIPQAGPHHVGVNLGCRQVGMSQHFLKAAQASASLEQMSRESMPKNVRRKMLKYARSFAVYFDSRPESLAGHPPAPRSDEKKRRMSVFEKSGPRLFDISPDHRQRGEIHRYDALFVALAGDADQPETGIEAGDLQTDQFADPDAGGVKDLQHGAIADAG